MLVMQGNKMIAWNKRFGLVINEFLDTRVMWHGLFWLYNRAPLRATFARSLNLRKMWKNYEAIALHTFLQRCEGILLSFQWLLYNLYRLRSENPNEQGSRVHLLIFRTFPRICLYLALQKPSVVKIQPRDRNESIYKNLPI